MRYIINKTLKFLVILWYCDFQFSSMVPAPKQGVNKQTTTVFLKWVANNKAQSWSVCITVQRWDIGCKETLGGAHSKTDEQKGLPSSASFAKQKPMHTPQMQAKSWNVSGENSLVQQAFAKHTQ